MRSDSPCGRPIWQRLARQRRWCLIGGAVAPGCAAGWMFLLTLPPGMPRILAVMLGILFSALFAWLAWNAWTTIAGMLALRNPRRLGALGRGLDAGPERMDPGRLRPHGPNPLSPRGERAAEGRTAIVFPICDEDTERVFAGLEATYRSLGETGQLEAFDVFVLSDSRDLQAWMREETAWTTLCKTVNGFGRIHYRRRTAPGGGKAENIADFCRRWGRLYRYMVVLDADSVMAGPTIVTLVDLMEAHPGVGIIQTLPMPVNRSSLFARIRQFASRLYGPLSAAGLAYWQLGDGVYWGHNAIVRVEPFMASCGLPRLPGTPPLGGQIMSHDVVEAAFMGRAGLTVWLAHDLEGSYEELPPTLPDYLARDRRWCRGNLQHGRLLWQPGLSFGHRLHLLLGIGSYVAAPLWLLFLVAEMMVAVGAGPTRGVFGGVPGGFRSGWMLSLLSATAVLLLAPKVLALGLVLNRAEEARRFGGRLRCTLSAVLEMVFSALTAPITMVSHAWFVISILTGARVRWTSPPRHDYALRWRDAMAHHTGATAAGTAWIAAAVRIHRPDIIEWLTPILAGLLLSIPISVFSSSVLLGTLARRWGLFLTPEETAPPRVLRELHLALDRRHARHHAAVRPVDAFVQAVVDPIANAQHVWQATFRARDGSSSAAHLVEKAVRAGPARLGADERAAILEDPESLAALHVAVWSAPTTLTRRWRLSG
jgi:membrane glycosyltransferase